MSPPLRVLVVIKSLGPGGAERLVLDQLRHADPTAVVYHLFVCRPRKPDLIGEAAAMGVRVHEAYESRVPWPAQLRTAIVRGRYDIVHAHLPLAAVGARLTVRTTRGRPRMVSTEHNRWQSYRRATRLLNRGTIRLDEASIAVSVDAAESMGFPTPRPVRVISHGVDRPALLGAPSPRDRLRAELGIADGTVAIGTVANLRRAKNQQGLLDAFAAADLGEQAVLLLVGQGPLLAELKSHAEQLQLGERVCFVGYRSDATSVMTAFDIFTLPSLHEGRPVALMEAMTLGLPVLVSDAGGMRDMVESELSGIVVPAGNVGALSEQMQRLVAQPELRDQLGSAAARAAVAFDGTQAYAAIEALYRDLLAPRH